MITDITITSLQTIQWEFQDPKMEVPTIYKAYVSEYHRKIWPYMVQYPKMGIRGS